MANLIVAEKEDALTRAAAERVTVWIERAIAARNSAVVSLTGGTTPTHLYEALADTALPWRARIDWTRVHLFWGDERHVPPDHHDSNFGMANAALVRQVPIPPSQVHRMRGELADAADAAREYDDQLRAGFAAAGRTDRTFDLMLLGMGDDAHIASIFPDSPLLRRDGEGRPSDPPLRRPVKGRPTNGPLEEHTVNAPLAGDPATVPSEGRDANGPSSATVGRGFMPRHERVAAIWVPHLGIWRITLTPPAILDARAIVMLVAGDKKAAAVRAAIEEPLDVARRPAQLLREAGDRVEWLLDRPAASLLHAAR